MVSKVCNLPCYSGPNGTMDVAHCKSGITVCQNDIVVECEGEMLPDPETCDMIDNDCDGEIDNRLSDWWVGRPCGLGVGECKSGREKCINGEQRCIGQTYGGEEFCDGLDNDCDGLVDNNLSVAFCYSSDPSTLAFGECRAGITECVDAREVCMYEIIPSTEVCNGLDDDCDGVADEDLTSKTDVFFLVDVSGSMGSSVFDVRDTLSMLASTLLGSETMMGAGYLPGDRFELFGSRDAFEVITDLETPAVFQAALPSLVNNGSGTETTINATYEVCYGSDVSWRGDASRFIVLFSDEHPQSTDATTVQDVVTECGNNGITLYAFTDIGFLSDYETMTTPLGGLSFVISHSSYMLNDLSRIFTGDCR